ncbi:serine protease inhibitor kazal-like protein, minor form isoform X2 [Meriones unguiculatus]|uniref:serine protease inhibitor kazal-like protein, minor form isoform X2 n=1 Tax=Meriones unguiculatus TaxID=10047 RepID=UPI00293E18A6|nr:serine protease inhibitor kazal-like protein, minor form isoform X2 [Meriones unguiculatus]
MKPLVVVPETDATGQAPQRKPPNCSQYKRKSMCTKEKDPICADDRDTYLNECFFCIAKLRRRIKLRYFGKCIEE